MSEVSSWSNTDAGNNLTPPDGWPEGMQPSGVNDCGRMMMGAIKRWYDTVTAGIANCLPLSGGTLTGALVVNGSVTANSVGISGALSAGSISSASNVTAAGQFNGNVNAGTIIASSNIVGNGNITASGQVSGNTVQGGYISSTGNIDASGAIGAPTIDAHTQLTSEGNLNVGGQADVTGSLTVHGGVTTVGDLNVGTVISISGHLFADLITDGAGTATLIADGSNAAAIVLYGANGSYYRCDNAHSFTNRAATVNIVRFQVTDGVCQNATGSWSTFSDAALKENLTPYTAGLAEVLQLNPQSFNYIAGKNPFDVGGGTYYGLVAQDVEPILPEMVSTDDDGIALLQPTHLVYVLLNAVKELEARLAQVENRGG